MERGRGFIFVGTQQRVPVGNTMRYADMVFYNKIFRAYALIDLIVAGLSAIIFGVDNLHPLFVIGAVIAFGAYVL